MKSSSWIKFSSRRKVFSMGAHFAPLIAILPMHRIECVALKILYSEKFSPLVYERQIDDVFLGPVERTHLLNKIQNTILLFA